MYKYQDLPEIISDILIKQDQTIEAIYQTGKKTDRTNEILEEFMAVSVKQWEQQTKFNELFYEKLEKFEKSSGKTFIVRRPY